MTEADFDTEAIVAQYRNVMTQLELQTTEPGRAEFRAAAIRLRLQWKNWQGADSLHEMAY